MKNTRSKFNVGLSAKDKQKRTFDGILFDSEAEMKYYRDFLLPRQENGEISNVIVHPSYLLQEAYTKYGRKIRPIEYELDFSYEKVGKTVLVDIKGMIQNDAKIKRKLFDYRYPDLELHWLSWSKIDGGWIDVEELEVNRKKRKKERGR